MSHQMDTLVYQAVFGSDAEKQQARFDIWQAGIEAGVIPSSINDLYMARGRGDLPNNFTVPAMNLRGMTYDTARAVFQMAVKHNVGALICEIARSEMGYTHQSPQEYVSVVTAAAVREGWSGPLFIQGDHFQAKPGDVAGQAKEGEIDKIKELIRDAVGAGFYNIDIDMSTLVILDEPDEADQQVPNYTYSAELAKFIRELEPEGVTISLGGEIGHVGGRNSTVEDLEAYLNGLEQKLSNDVVGLSKISVQTGTSHGGVVRADGTLAEVDVDFSILRDISKVCQEKYQIGGSVQHGASTLPDEFFNEFAKNQALEVHLATGFQNIIFDHPDFPDELRQKMYDYVDDHHSDERKKDQTDEQFHYKLRKKSWGPFKQECWDLPTETRDAIRQTLAKRFEFFFKELNVVNTREMVDRVVKPVIVEKTVDDFAPAGKKAGDVKGLDD